MFMKIMSDTLNIRFNISTHMHVFHINNYCLKLFVVKPMYKSKITDRNNIPTLPTLKFE